MLPVQSIHHATSQRMRRVPKSLWGCQQLSSPQVSGDGIVRAAAVAVAVDAGEMQLGIFRRGGKRRLAQTREPGCNGTQGYLAGPDCLFDRCRARWRQVWVEKTGERLLLCARALAGGSRRRQGERKFGSVVEGALHFAKGVGVRGSSLKPGALGLAVRVPWSQARMPQEDEEAERLKIGGSKEARAVPHWHRLGVGGLVAASLCTRTGVV